MFGLIKVFSANMFLHYFFQFKDELLIKIEVHTIHEFKKGNEKQLGILL
jgi:hypothetical protein